MTTILLTEYRCPVCKDSKHDAVEQIGETFSDFNVKPPIMGKMKLRCLTCKAVFIGEHGKKPRLEDWPPGPILSMGGLVINGRSLQQPEFSDAQATANELVKSCIAAGAKKMDAHLTNTETGIRLTLVFPGAKQVNLKIPAGTEFTKTS